MRKSILKFTAVCLISLPLLSYLYCGCLPWLLILSLWLFFTFFLILFSFTRILLVSWNINPLSYLFLSFGMKLILLLGFGIFIVTYFEMDHKSIIFLYVTGYIITGIFDFVIMESASRKISADESESE